MTVNFKQMCRAARLTVEWYPFKLVGDRRQVPLRSEAFKVAEASLRDAQRADDPREREEALVALLRAVSLIADESVRNDA